MLFKDVIGQAAVKQQLVEMVQHNRLSHALLFLGREGSGALPLAMAFAAYIASLPKASDAQPSMFGGAVEVKLPSTAAEADEWMARQPSFSKTEAMVHPDIHYSYPVVPKKPGDKPVSTDYAAEWREAVQHHPYSNVFDWLQAIGAENKQGNITAAECNDINRKLSLKSFESGYKILVMWMPEYLKNEGNKLLKLIEEPPPDTLFILVAENESAMLLTILSRCQLVKVPALQAAEIEEALVRKAGIAAEKARTIATAAEGNYRDALQSLQHADEDYYKKLREWLNAIFKGNVLGQVKAIEDLARLGREAQKQFLRYFTHLLEQAVRLEATAEGQQKQIMEGMAEDEKNFVLRLNQQMALEQKEAIATELDKAAYYIERNANAKILFHALTIKIFHIVKNGVVFLV